MLKRGGTVKLQVHSNFDMLDFVQMVSDRLAHLGGLDDDAVHWIGVAVRESVINAIKHGNRMEADKPVDIKFTLDRSTLTIYVRDRGVGFDPLLIPDPLDPENLLNPSGRGIFYMKTFMDEVDFSHHPDGGTVVRMVKRRSDPETKGDTASDGPSND